jgi:Zn-dependent peptidase ImmA (M78 family)
MVPVKIKATKIHQLISCEVKSMEFILREAERLIQKHKTRNPFEIADCLNINVLYRPLGKLKGIYIYTRRSRYICINNDLDSPARRLVCAHEIVHDRFHRHLAKMNPQAQELISYDMSSKPEREANVFAAEILLPDDEVIKLINDAEMNFFRAARELYVPPELMDFKFQILKNRGYRLEAPLNATGDFLKK